MICLCFRKFFLVVVGRVDNGGLGAEWGRG